MTAYFDAAEGLGRRLLPLYAEAYGLPAGFFDAHFEGAQRTLRLIHYPVGPKPEQHEGLGAHTDLGFMTMSPSNSVPGLSMQLPDGQWRDAPAVPGAILINGGDILKRWTNDEARAVTHKVRASTQIERVSMPFFFNPSREATIEALPTLTSADNPARDPPVKFGTYQDWYLRGGTASGEKRP